MGGFHLFKALVPAVILLLIVSGSAVASGGLQGRMLPPFQWEKVDERLWEKAQASGVEAELEFLIRLSEGASLESVKFQGEEVVSRLKEAAATSQAAVIPSLEERGFVVKRSFWIANALLVEGPAKRLGELTRVPGVSRIVDNFAVSLIDDAPSASPTISTNLTWGLERVGAERVWSDLGVRGESVRMCVSDTGVDITHPDLVGKIWTDAAESPQYPGGWIEFDRWGQPLVGSRPHDSHGHGTHTSGILAGGNASGPAIGMAPGAKLMHALVLPAGSGSFSQVIAGMEWCVRPHDENGDPAGQQADVHSMSWGVTGYRDELVEPIRNSYFAGTLPVAAVGNCNANCSGSPGNVYETLGVGASDIDDLIPSFSSGEIVTKASWRSPPPEWPSEWGVPLLAAPGVDVYSSLPGGGYAEWSGTSMATPHVAGCAGLMMSANSNLAPDEIREALRSSARWYDTYNPTPPDARYGWGRLDCLAAVHSIAFRGGIRGSLWDAEDGEAVDQALVRVMGPGLNERRVYTDATGFFEASLGPGVYDLSIERFGYDPLALGNISVEEALWVDVELPLVPVPRGNITGSVLQNATGSPVPGVTVTLLHVPVTVVFTTNETGSFTLGKVPEGSYELRATSPYFWDLEKAGVQVTRDADSTVDFRLDPKDWVAVVGDDEAGTLAAALRGEGYYVEGPTLDRVVQDPCRYRSVVVNRPEVPDNATLDRFIAETDRAGTGVIFLDTKEHSVTGGGIYYLWQYRSDPQFREDGENPFARYLYYQVEQSHAILDPYGPGEILVFENSAGRHDYAWFDAYTGENGTVIALAGTDVQGLLGPAIAVDERSGNRHVLLSLHGVSQFIGPDDWTSAGTDLFLRAVDWSKGAPCSNALTVDFGLEVDPPAGLWHETFRVTVKAMNVGNAGGNHTARLYVDDLPEGEKTVSLLPGEVQVVGFGVTRDAVGSYRVSVGPHMGSLAVQPPKVTVLARDLGGAPLEGASVVVELNSSTSSMGETDENGTLAFDSPTGSHGRYSVVLQVHDGGQNGLQYLLSQELSVEDDVIASFLPAGTATRVLDIQMVEGVEGQKGVVDVKRAGNTSAFARPYTFAPRPIVVDGFNYTVASLITAEAPGSTWTIRTVPVDLGSGASPVFRFGGPLRMETSWIQLGSSTWVTWNITDAYGHEIDRVVQNRVGLLGAEDVTLHRPLVSLWSPAGGLLASGYVDWGQTPIRTTLPADETLAFVHIDLDTGPYPFENLFELVVEVLDVQGRTLPVVAASGGGVVSIRGTVLRSGQPLPVNLTLNDLPVEVDLNGAFSTTFNLAEGLNTLNIAARDLVGHERLEVYVIYAKPDVLLAVEPLPEVTNAPQVTVRGMVERGARLTVNGRPSQPGQDGAFSVTLALEEGRNTITVAAQDRLGNRKEIVSEVILDTLPPEITILTPAPGQSTRDAEVTIVGRTEPTARIVIDDVRISLEDGGFMYTSPLKEGENIFAVEAVDGAGNVRVLTLKIYRESPLLAGSATYWLLAIPAIAAALAMIRFYAMPRWTKKASEVPTGRAEEATGKGE